MTPRGRLSGLRAYGALTRMLLDPLAETRRITQAHGDFAVIDLSLGKARAPVMHLVGAAHAETVFMNHKLFANGGLIAKGYKGSTHNQLRQGYFSANGDEHEHYIRIFGPLFRKKVVEDAYPVIERVVDEGLNSWPDGAIGDIIPYINRLMKNLASQGLFRDPDLVAGLAAADMVERHGRLGGASIGGVVAAKWGRPSYSRLHRQAQATFEALVAWGESHRRAGERDDILAAIVNTPDEHGGPATPQRIAGYGWTMLGASYDTSTSILSWLLVLLSTHPEVARKLQEEVLEHAGAHRDTAALMELPYLDAVIKEALRLVPPAPIQRRKVMADTQISGREAPAGSQVLVSAWMTNRDPVLYPDPDRFRPERWQGMVRSPYQWLTFSAGPRRCLGIWFAYAFLKTILAGIVTRWSPRIPDGATINMKVAVTVRPTPAIPIVLGRPGRPQPASRLSGNVGRRLELG